MRSSPAAAGRVPGGVLGNQTLLLVVIVIITSACLATFFPDGDLDTLGCETLAEVCAIAYTWELLGRVDLEDVTEH